MHTGKLGSSGNFSKSIFPEKIDSLKFARKHNFPSSESSELSDFPRNPSLSGSLSTSPKSSELSDSAQKSSESLEANSYKFSRPRVYVKNCFESDRISVLDHLKYIATNVGPKGRTPAYEQFLTRQLQQARPKSSKKATKKKEVSINNIDFSSPTLKLAEFHALDTPIRALVDTGSTHCLISVNTFKRLKGFPFTPLKVHMKVAGSVLKDNVVGSTVFGASFSTEEGKVTIPLTFLVAHALNGYEAILGATLLMNPEMTAAITPTHLCLTPEYNSFNIRLEAVQRRMQANYMRCEEVVIPPGATLNFPATVTPPFSRASREGLETVSVSGEFTILECIQTSLESVQCTVKNSSKDELSISPQNYFGLAYEKVSISQVNEINSFISSPEGNVPEAGFTDSDFSSDSIDDQIISEHQLFDPSDLDKTFKYTDCEINPNLDPDIRAKLDKILFDYQSVFATSKLDVGRFPDFTVSLDIDAEIPAEKQRFMSEEKLAYCEKTFGEFEKLGLVQETHSPKTVSNLLLVPKYEGLRDLTKASVYLAQVRGEKNSSFRIVQDLRRINAKTKNVKKASPKLPEFIFQKLKNKVVSSVDANMAYWHLVLDPESRSYTAFYLKGRKLQFCRLPQGCASAPACWDEAMARIFSCKTMRRIKAMLDDEEASLLPDSFEDFFAYYQDDSWIFSDSDEIHLLHLKVVFMAYKMFDIKLSANKSTFFPVSFKILGVSLTPRSSELALDRVKAESILDWEKPDSLYTLQSRLYALNYWTKFIPSLAELKFPLQQIVRSQVFTWNEEADLAWQRIKAIIALDIRLTIPEQDEQLLLTTDASKIACSCILWVQRGDSLRVVGCYSKLFSHTDSLKSIHFKETYAMVLAFDHFKAYLLNTQKSVIVFTDARALMWVGRNREYSIACNGLVNKLAKIQLEIPHVVYSVPSEVNFLADVFSRAFSTSRFLDKSHFALSKVQANRIPPLTEPFLVTESALYQYFTLPLGSESEDQYPRRRNKISTPKPISSLYKLFKDCTPEEKYLSALRLLQGWDDPSLADSEANSIQLTEHSSDQEMDRAALHALDNMQKNRQDIFDLYHDRVIRRTVELLYGDLDPAQKKRMEATLRENHKHIIRRMFIDTMKEDFLQHEQEMKSAQVNLTEPCKDDISVNVRYSVIHPSCFHPSKQENSPGIDIPIQQEVFLPPNGCETVDTGIQLVLPGNLCAQLIPHSSSSQVNLHIHSGPVDSNYSSTIKLLLRNNSQSPVKIQPGTCLVQALILPLLHPSLIHEPAVHSNSVRVDDSCNSPESGSGFGSELEDRSDSSIITRANYSEGLSVPLNNLKLSSLPISFLHLMTEERVPSHLNILETNTDVFLPNSAEARSSIFVDLSSMESEEERKIKDDLLIPISIPNPNTESLVQDLTRDLMDQTAYLNSTVSSLPKDSNLDESKVKEIRDSAYNSICEKLAVISVDLIKNKTMTRTMLARAQQADDYLGVIRDKMGTPDNSFPRFFVKDQVLYKKCMQQNSVREKHVICIPDILLPSVIHTLHVNLNHTSITVTKRNFEQYYYNRNSTKMIKSYIQSCVTCALSHKFDIKRTAPETKRSLQPNRPRQYIYCDLIPMYAGIFSYILFCLDAYSQYVYAIPVKDKTSASVLQGFLALFGSTGWPEAIYLDNETSFQKTAKMLVKVAPIKVLYSTPYCQFQNWSENYIKNFKKGFLKLLNDSENPQDNSDWPLLLPTVTQALNRQVIPNIGMTRETIHFNMETDFYPLAHLSAAADSHINQTVNNILAADAFKIVLQKRQRDRGKRLQARPVPLFHETQLVFMRDQAPGISTILKVPNRGPYRIDKLEERNVSLTELGTGKTVSSHIQNIRPLDLSEYRLLLSKGWDLNAHQLKSGLPVSNPSIFDFPQHPVPEDTIVEIERQQDQYPQDGDLDNLFVNQAPTVPEGDLPAQVQPSAVPPDIPEVRPTITLRRSPRNNPSTRRLDAMLIDLTLSEEEISDDEGDLGEQTLSVNTTDVQLEVSPLYRLSLQRKISIYPDEVCFQTEIRQNGLSAPRPILRKKRSVSFYLPETPPYIFYPKYE